MFASELPRILQDPDTLDALRVLVVEDDPGDIFLLKQALLRRAPCNFRVITTGDSAIAFIKQEEDSKPYFHADLVILDINLPGKDGGDVMAHLRAKRETCRTVVVVLSSLPAEVQRAKVPWADSYLTKPCDLDDYLALGSEIMQCYARGAAGTLRNLPVL